MSDHPKNNQKFYSGLSGVVLPIPKYRFPLEHAQSSRLTYYATFFKSVEINSTFYKLPLQATVEKWANSVPQYFKFTFKLWQEITHVKDLLFRSEDVASFFNVVSGAKNNAGCVLIQFPPSLSKRYLPQLQMLLKCVSENNNEQLWKIAIEFRNNSWYEADTYEILKMYGCGLVIHDIPKSATPMLTHISDFIYLRFHGPTGNYRESYPEYFLSEYASYIREWLEQGKIVYTYFNNTMGDAFKNCQQISESVSAE